MKGKTLALLAGVAAPLIATTQAAGGFVGVHTVTKPNPFGLLVLNVYAEFDRPGEDHMVSVGGTPNHPLLIEVAEGTFYNHGLGSDLAPQTTIIAAFPSLAFDSFVTIGVKSVGLTGQPFDNLVLTPGFPGVSGSELFITNGGWAITPLDPQGDPFDPVFVAGDGNVLIGQFTTADPSPIFGQMLLSVISNGQTEQHYVFFPSPGALALLGTAGLLGATRRRRGSP